MLKIDHLSASYKTIDGNVHVVKDVDFEIRDNEIFGIAGESGCGKSTLLKTLYDIIEFPLEIDKGKVVLNGTKNGKDFSFESGNIRNSWWNQISYVPQAAQSVLNPIVRLKDQFLDSIPKETKDETTSQTLARVAKYFEDLGLSPDVLDAYPFQLSGGMRQRAVIALATFMAPNVVLADEPTTALDVVVQRGILMMLTRLQRQFKNSLVIVSHDMGVHYHLRGSHPSVHQDADRRAAARGRQEPKGRHPRPSAGTEESPAGMPLRGPLPAGDGQVQAGSCPGVPGDQARSLRGLPLS